MKRHSGITLIGFIFVLIIGAFFALMAMKLVPAYIEYFGVVKAMKSLASEPGSAEMSLSTLRSKLNFKGNFQYVDDQTLASKRAVRVVRDKGQVNLVVTYDKHIPFIYNVDFLVHFNKTVPLSGRGG